MLGFFLFFSKRGFCMNILPYAVLGAALIISSVAVCDADPLVPVVSVTDLGTLGGSDSSGYGVNNKGQVAGTSHLPGNKLVHGFFYTDGKMTDLGTLGGDQSEAHALNDAGQVTGNAELKPKDRQYHAFLWQQGRMSELGTSRADSSDGLAMNGAGQVVGRIIRGPFSFSRACRWKNGKVDTLDTPTFQTGISSSESDSINNKGQVACALRREGITSSTTPFITYFTDQAALWNAGKMFELAPRTTEISLANAINDDGLVVGAIFVDPDMALHACSWQNGKMTDLGTLAGLNTVAYAVNRAGLIVGGTNPVLPEENGKQFGDADEPQHAFCCFKGEIIDLNDLIDPASGWVLADARSISDSNYVTGTGVHNGQAHAYLLKLPATL